MVATTGGVAGLQPLSFADLAGWADDDQAAALAAFRRGAAVLHEHGVKERPLGGDPALLAAALMAADALPRTLGSDAARAFFASRFRPYQIDAPGFFTGFYEPEVAGSLTATPPFTVPLYRRPDDLVEIEPGVHAGIPESFRFARRTARGVEEHPDRAAIAAGALAGRGLELVYLADPVDAFFAQVQGAARVRLGDGGLMRITYDGKSGHPYTAIGRVLVERGAMALAEVTMQSIRAWLAAHGDEAGAVMAANRSYVFFREAPVVEADLGPVAAAKVALTAGRSLAVDRTLHPFHTPVWVETTLPGGARFRRLTIAQDTGSAIVGPARGDIFFGSGDAAGEIAGRMRAAGRFVVLIAGEPAP
jgi:membrane-bound lytic murein transglycosylase A